MYFSKRLFLLSLFCVSIHSHSPQSSYFKLPSHPELFNFKMIYLGGTTRFTKTSLFILTYTEPYLVSHIGLTLCYRSLGHYLLNISFSSPPACFLRKWSLSPLLLLLLFLAIIINFVISSRRDANTKRIKGVFKNLFSENAKFLTKLKKLCRISHAERPCFHGCSTDSVLHCSVLFCNAIWILYG